MSFELPASLEQDLERFAQSKNITPTEAAVKLIRDALATAGRRGRQSNEEAVDWERFQDLVPGAGLFRALPEGTVGDLAKSSLRIRAEKLKTRA